MYFLHNTLKASMVKDIKYSHFPTVLPIKPLSTWSFAKTVWGYSSAEIWLPEIIYMCVVKHVFMHKQCMETLGYVEKLNWLKLSRSNQNVCDDDERGETAC